MNTPQIPRLETPQTKHIRASYPTIEYLEQGYVADWLKERKDQLLELAREERSGINANKLISGAVLAAGFFFHALSPLAPVGVVLGIIGYAHGCYVDATHNGSFSPLPFVRGNVLDVAGTLGNADLREKEKLNGAVDEFEILQHYLPLNERKEYRFLQAHFITLSEYITQVEPLKRFHAYRWIFDCFLHYQGALPSPQQIQTHMANVASDVRVDHTYLEALEERRAFLAGRNQPRTIEEMGQFTPIPQSEPVKFIGSKKLTQDVPSEDQIESTLTFSRQDGVEVTHVARSQQSFDIVAQMTKDLTNHIICAVPGGGKGMLVSNALQAIKKAHPNLTIFVIDPKADEKESGYFCGKGYIVHRAQVGLMESSEVVDWFKKRIKEFDEIKGAKLLVFDEATLVTGAFQIIGKEDLKWLKRRFQYYASSGDSFEIRVWIICQNPDVESLGFNGGIRSQFSPIAIVSKKNPAALNALLSTSFLPKNDKLNINSVIESSPVNRAVFYGGFNQWLPMPKLENLSGYDRDTRSKIQNKDALSTEERALLQSRIEAQQVEIQSEASKPEGTEFVFQLLDKTQSTTWEQFIIEDMLLQPDLVETTLDTIASTLEEYNRPDLAKLRSKNPSQDFQRWLKGLKKKPSDDQIKKRMQILTGKQLDERAVAMIREKFGL